MKNGDKVKFKHVVDAGDENLIFEILEMRGDRALVGQLNSGMNIQPTFVYATDDLEVVC